MDTLPAFAAVFLFGILFLALLAFTYDWLQKPKLQTTTVSLNYTYGSPNMQQPQAPPFEKKEVRRIVDG